MKRLFAIVLFLNVAFCSARSQEILIQESTSSPLSKIVTRHVESLIKSYGELLSATDLQLLVNILFASYHSMKADLEYDKVIAKLVMTLLKLKTNFDDALELTKKLGHLLKKLNASLCNKNKAHALWVLAIQYLELEEFNQVACIFEAIAEQRYIIVQEYLHNNRSLLINSYSEVFDDAISIAKRINTVACTFKNLEKKSTNNEDLQKEFDLLHVAYKSALALEAEQPKLIEAMNPVVHHVEDLALMNAVLDSLYYVQFSNFLKNTFHEEPMNFFDEKGVISQDRRNVPLPSVYFCNDFIA